MMSGTKRFGTSGILLAAAILLFNPAATIAQDSTDAQKQVIITEYSDFQCGACAYFHPIVKQLKEEMGSRVEIRYRFFPLNNHQYGALSARAAQAARNQGKYLEMHNLLFENQTRWANSRNPQPIFEQFARDIGLDLEQFRNDLNAAETQRRVMEEKQEGIQKGVNATPTFFINGDKIQSTPPTFEAFRALVESYLEE